MKASGVSHVVGSLWVAKAVADAGHSRVGIGASWANSETTKPCDSDLPA